MKTETRFRELRAHGRRLTGTVMRYGDEARYPASGAERFSAFAFDRYLRHGRGATRLNVMHEPDLIVASTRRGDLAFTDSPEALDMVATLPSGSAYDSVLELVGDGLTTGLSVEFVALEERRTNGTRVVMRAALPGSGLVDEPAYAASGVEVRRRGRGLSGEYRYNTDRVTRDRGRRRKVRVSSGAFSWQLEAFAKLQEKLQESRSRRRSRAAAADAVRESAREVQLLAGRSYDASLASLRTGTLKLENTDEALKFEVDTLPATSYATDLRAGMDSGAADYGVDLLYSHSARGRGTGRARNHRGTGQPGVEIEIVRSRHFAGDSDRLPCPSWQRRPGRKGRRAVTPARRARVWL